MAIDECCDKMERVFKAIYDLFNLSIENWYLLPINWDASAGRHLLERAMTRLIYSDR